MQTVANSSRAVARLLPIGSRLKSSATPRPLAFAFDIDGVLKQGDRVLEPAKEALQILTGNNRLKRRFPFICITNGGGSVEEQRAKRLTRELGVEIGVHQIVQSHTIFRALTQEYKDLPILVVGGRGNSCREVAENYGFTRVYCPPDILAWEPSIWPFHRVTEEESTHVRKGVDFSQVKFAAILVFHDSWNWGRDVQLICDLVRAKDGIFGTSDDSQAAGQQIPVYFSNPDLLWGNEWTQSRFGQGAFQESVAAVYKATTGKDLERKTGGKPTKATYDYSANLLFSAIDATKRGTHVDLHATESPKFDGRVYMVGDNPASDIAGANAYGWEGILLRTGVFRGKVEDAVHQPTIVKDNVLDGVLWALEREGHTDIL